MVISFIVRGKVCPSCKEHKRYSAFQLSRERPDGYQAYCRDCHAVKTKITREKYPDRVKARRKKYVAENVEKVKNKNRRVKLKNEYGISIEDYNIMLENQNSSCAMCGKHQSEIDRRLDVDHCHITGKVRGLLCGECNRRLGIYEMIKDSAKAYLERYG